MTRPNSSEFAKPYDLLRMTATHLKDNTHQVLDSEGYLLFYHKQTLEYE